MNISMRYELGNIAARLADLIVHARPAQIRFQSEEQFLEMLGLPLPLPLNPVSARAQQRPSPGSKNGRTWKKD
jgi:hypothetical protein